MNISILGYENTALLLQQSGIGRYIIRCVLFFLFAIFVVIKYFPFEYQRIE